MSFFFARARAKTNAVELPKQARDYVTKLEGPTAALKVNKSESTRSLASSPLYIR